MLPHGLNPPRERYFHDPQFKAFVDMLTSHILQCNYTPSEIREAALLASIKYYEMRPQGLIVRADQLHELMRKMEQPDGCGRETKHAEC